MKQYNYNWKNKLNLFHINIFNRISIYCVGSDDIYYYLIFLISMPLLRLKIIMNNFIGTNQKIVFLNQKHYFNFISKGGTYLGICAYAPVAMIRRNDRGNHKIRHTKQTSVAKTQQGNRLRHRHASKHSAGSSRFR